MIFFTKILVYPEGDRCETTHFLTFNQLVDLNGIPLKLPLQSAKTIVYRVYKISTEEKRGETITYFHLDLVTGDELFSLAQR